MQQRAVRNTHLPRFYSKVLGPKLQERFKELCATSHEEQVALHEELVLARLSCEQAVKIAAPILEGDKVKDSTRAMALAALNAGVAHVRETVLACARVEALSKDTVSVRVVQLVIQQVVRIIFKACGDENEEVAKRIEIMVRDIRLPKAGQESSVEPIELEAEMREMIGSIGGPEPDKEN